MKKRYCKTVLRAVALALLVLVFLAVRASHARSEEAASPPVATPAASSTDEAPRISITDPRRIVADAGPVMYAIMFCSFMLVAFTFERMSSLRRGRVIPKPFVSRFIEQLQQGQLDRRQALELCEENASPVAAVFAGAIRKWGRPSVEIEQGVIDAGERVTNGLRKYLRVFYGISTVGPLLGLMGTVLGMIHTFNSIASADALGRVGLLAGGIAEALLNTAGGLAVAIPASVLYVFFVSRIDRLVIEIDRLSQEVVNAISAEEICDRKTVGTKLRHAA